MPSAVPLLLSLALSGLEPRASIGATWSDGHGLVSHPGEVQSEIAAILGSAGIRVRWTEDGLAVGSAIHVAVVVSPSPVVLVVEVVITVVVGWPGPTDSV